MCLAIGKLRLYPAARRGCRLHGLNEPQEDFSRRRAIADESDAVFATAVPDGDLAADGHVAVEANFRGQAEEAGLTHELFEAPGVDRRESHRVHRRSRPGRRARMTVTLTDRNQHGVPIQS